MHNTLTIARKELRSYFDTPVAYIVLVTFLLVTGWMFFSTFFLMGRADLRMLFSPSPFSPSMLLVIIAPALTMRLVAEEKKSGTIELMATLPITDTELIIGKFLGALALVVCAIGATFFYPISISWLGDLDWGPVLAGYVGLMLFASSLLAIGLLMSTFTDNQIVAFIMSFIICAGLYFLFWLKFLVPEILAPVLEYISVSFHLDNLARGVLDTRDVLYYVTLTAGALFLSVQSLKNQHA
jgi:ABC-2 type transport system permease protein